jgi:mono/diheme cytochrome c family protein
MKLLALVNFAGILVPWLALAEPGPNQDQDPRLERGEYVFHAAGCASCHSGPLPLAGGRPLSTPFGTFYAPNISPDLEHGIGTWSEEDFIRALREGISPRGQHYYPAFPYLSYTRMSEEDMRALWVYLRARPAQAAPDRPHELLWFVSARALLGPWKQGSFTPGAWQPDPSRSAAWNRGAYIAQAFGHCGECHTPRGPLGGPRKRLRLAGARQGPDGRRVPNITPDPETGLGHWNQQDWLAFFDTGQRPDGRFTGPMMMEVLCSSIQPLSPADRRALVSYLRSMPAIRYDVELDMNPFADTDYFQ